jgi:hypothetical protein
MDTKISQHLVLAIITAILVIVVVDLDFWSGIGVFLICDWISGYLQARENIQDDLQKDPHNGT